MTVQQHAPRIAQVRPQAALPAALLPAFVAIVLVALVALAVWLLVEPTTPVLPTYYETMRELQQLRELIPGGFI